MQPVSHIIMCTLINQAAWLKAAGSALEVDDAPMPEPGADEIVVKNAAVAINPLDCHMQDVGVFVQQWPTIFGCDVAGEVHEVGSGVQHFKKGDRVIGCVRIVYLPRMVLIPHRFRHCINLVTGRPADGAYALFTIVPASKAALLPDHISFTDGVVVPFALEAAVCSLSAKEPGPCMPGVSTPALGLPYPTLVDHPLLIGKVIVIYGASSSVGTMTTQIAAAAGIRVIAIAGAHNQDLVKECGATLILDHKDTSLVDKVVNAVQDANMDFVGIIDAVSIAETYARDLQILERLGGGHLACVHPPPTEDVPHNVDAGMIFAVNDIATPVFEEFVTSALECGKLKCLPPPTIVGKGLEHVNEALSVLKSGVSGTKLVVEL